MNRAPGGRHGGPRRPVPLPARAAGLVVVVLALIGATAMIATPWSSSGDEGGAAGRCDNPTLRVAADPAIAGVIAQATRDLGPWLEPDECLAVTVSAVESAEVATGLGREAGVGFAAPLPDFWVPDSSVWLAVARATQAGRERLPDDGASVASSPVVVAVPAGSADASGWPGEQPTWDGLLAAQNAAVAMPDPRTDAAAMATLLAIMGERQQSLAAVARRFTVPLSTDGPSARLAAQGEVGAVPASEVEVIRVNRASGAESVLAGYDPGVASSLDFPLVAIAPYGGPVADDVARAGQVLLDVLLHETTQELFGTSGLRTPDGTLTQTWQERAGVLTRPVDGGDAYPADRVRSVAERWATVGRRFRLLMLVDRSGSMAAALQGSFDSKADLAQAALADLVRSLAPDSDMGLWSFTTGLPGGDTDVLVDTGPVGAPLRGQTRRDVLLTAVRRLDPKIGGSTPLYDAVRAGYRDAQRDYAYGRLNALVVVSDGRNEDAPSISLPQLLDSLRLQFDGVRPVRIITVAYGAGADGATLRRISSVTGGRSYRARTEADIARVLTRALAAL